MSCSPLPADGRSFGDHSQLSARMHACRTTLYDSAIVRFDTKTVSVASSADTKPCVSGSDEHSGHSLRPGASRSDGCGDSPAPGGGLPPCLCGDSGCGAAKTRGARCGVVAAAAAAAVAASRCFWRLARGTKTRLLATPALDARLDAADETEPGNAHDDAEPYEPASATAIGDAPPPDGENAAGLARTLGTGRARGVRGVSADADGAAGAKAAGAAASSITRAAEGNACVVHTIVGPSISQKQPSASVQIGRAFSSNVTASSLPIPSPSSSSSSSSSLFLFPASFLLLVSEGSEITTLAARQTGGVSGKTNTEKRERAKAMTFFGRTLQEGLDRI